MKLSADYTGEISDYFEEKEAFSEKPIILSTDNLGHCFFGRFSVPTHARNMTGAMYLDYSIQKKDIDILSTKSEQFNLDQKTEIINVHIRDSNSRHCIGRPVSLNNSNYVSLIDKGSYFEARILQGSFVFDPNIRGKNESNSDIAENIKRDCIVREAAITARIQESSNHSRIKLEKESEDDPSDNYVFNELLHKNHVKNSTTSEVALNDRLDDVYDEDFGLKQQEKKRRISAMSNKERFRDDSRIVTSALSLTTLENGDEWDYDGDGKMSDDEEYIEKSEMDEKYDGENNPNIFNGNMNFTNSEDEEGPDGILSEYGQSLKTMIANQQDMEADEELNVYSDEMDDEAESKSNVSSSVPIVNNISLNQEKGSSDIQKGLTKSPTVVSSSINGTSRTLETEVIRKLSLAGGRMQIKPFLDAMRVKKKNKYFEEIQEIIKKVADTHTEYHSNNKISYITLKSNYRQR